jgi:hypothetical protein
MLDTIAKSIPPRPVEIHHAGEHIGGRLVRDRELCDLMVELDHAIHVLLGVQELSNAREHVHPEHFDLAVEAINNAISVLNELRMKGSVS